MFIPCVFGYGCILSWGGHTPGAQVVQYAMACKWAAITSVVIAQVGAVLCLIALIPLSHIISDAPHNLSLVPLQPVIGKLSQQGAGQSCNGRCSNIRGVFTASRISKPANFPLVVCNVRQLGLLCCRACAGHGVGGHTRLLGV